MNARDTARKNMLGNPYTCLTCNLYNMLYVSMRGMILPLGCSDSISELDPFLMG